MKQLTHLLLAIALLVATGAQAQTTKTFGPLAKGIWTLEDVSDAEGYSVTFTNKGTGLPVGIPELQVDGSELKLVTAAKTWIGTWKIEGDSLLLNPGEGMAPRAFRIVSMGANEMKLHTVADKQAIDLFYRRKDAATVPGK
jgi:hypothetical protein